MQHTRDDGLDYSMRMKYGLKRCKRLLLGEELRARALRGKVTQLGLGPESHVAVAASLRPFLPTHRSTPN